MTANEASMVLALVSLPMFIVGCVALGTAETKRGRMLASALLAVAFVFAAPGLARLWTTALLG